MAGANKWNRTRRPHNGSRAECARNVIVYCCGRTVRSRYRDDRNVLRLQPRDNWTFNDNNVPFSLIYYRYDYYHNDINNMTFRYCRSIRKIIRTLFIRRHLLCAYVHPENPIGKPEGGFSPHTSPPPTDILNILLYYYYYILKYVRRYVVP